MTPEKRQSIGPVPGLAVTLAVLLTAASCSGSRSSFPEFEPFPPELETRLHAIRDGAAEVRHLDVNEETIEGQLAQATLREYYEESAEELDATDREELKAFNIAYRLMHLIGPEDDLLEMFGTDYAETILGLYLPAENRLALVTEGASDISGSDEILLAHEYVHSFQTAAFNRERLWKLVQNEEPESRTEYRSTVSCLSEGDASLAMVLYGEDVYGPDWREKTFGADGDEPEEEEEDTSIPPGMQRYFSFDYRECARFVRWLYDDGGWASVDAAYEDPPWTTEHILHPETYRAREGVRSETPASILESLDEDWEQMEVSLFGEFDVYNYLASTIEDEAVAGIAAAGWGAGWIGVYVDQEGASEAPDVLIHLQLDWDTSADYLEFLIAYGALVEVVSGGNWQDGGENGPLRWQGDGEYGSVTWNDDLLRVDIVIASDRDARESVLSRR